MKKSIFTFAIACILLSCGNNNTNEQKNETSKCCSSTCSSKCTDESKSTINNTNTQTESLQVLSFHGKKRCITCNAIEKLTREVVTELNNPNIKLQVLEITENENIANKYEVAWSSLILDNGTNINNLTQMAFANAKNNPENFKEKLKKEISKMIK